MRQNKPCLVFYQGKVRWKSAILRNFIWTTRWETHRGWRKLHNFTIIHKMITLTMKTMIETMMTIISLTKVEESTCLCLCVSVYLCVPYCYSQASGMGTRNTKLVMCPRGWYCQVRSGRNGRSKNGVRLWQNHPPYSQPTHYFLPVILSIYTILQDPCHPCSSPSRLPLTGSVVLPTFPWYLLSLVYLFSFTRPLLTTSFIVYLPSAWSHPTVHTLFMTLSSQFILV